MEAPGRPMTVSRTWQEIGALEVAIVSGIFSKAEVGGVAVCGVGAVESRSKVCKHSSF
jgi:hypothetical protein